MFLIHETSPDTLFTSFEAAEAGSDATTINNAQELADSATSTATMVKTYNQITGASVTRFSSRKNAADRLWAAVERMETDPAEPRLKYEAVQVDGAWFPRFIPVGDNQPVELEVEQVVEDEPAPKAKTGGRPKGTSKFAGKRIFAKRERNPRQKVGGHGWRSYQIIIGKPEGVLYEDYLEAGGRSIDLNWDLERGFAIIK